MTQILIAEDDKFSQTVLMAIIKAAGAVGTVTDDGHVCVKEFASNPKKYKLVLMDICMPNMDGYKATAEIRKIDSKIIIIGLSGDNDAKTIEAAKKAGMNSIIQKPIKKAELVEIIKGI